MMALMPINVWLYFALFISFFRKVNLVEWTVFMYQLILIFVDVKF